MHIQGYIAKFLEFLENREVVKLQKFFLKGKNLERQEKVVLGVAGDPGMYFNRHVIPWQ